MYRALSDNVIIGDEFFGIKTINKDIGYCVQLIIKRIISQIIDICLMTFLGVFFTVLVIAPAVRPDGDECGLLAIVCMLFFMVIYNTISDWIWHGETIGMRIMKLKIQFDNGFRKKRFIFHGLIKTGFLIIFAYTVVYLFLNEKAPYDKYFSISTRAVTSLKPV